MTSATYRGNAQRTGVYETRGVPEWHGVKWRVRTARLVESLVIEGEVGYFGGSALHAVDLQSGAITVKCRAEGGVLGPTVDGGVAYFVSRKGTLHAVDTASGRQKWRVAVPLAHPVYGATTAVVGDTLLAIFWTDSGASPCAVEAATGRSIWPEGAPLLGADDLHEFAAGDGLLFASSFEGNHSVSFYAFRIATGEVAWDGTVATGIEGTPAVVDGTVYAVQTGGRLIALDAAGGITKWEYPSDEQLFGDDEDDGDWDATTEATAPAVDSTTAYFGLHNLDSQAGAVYAVDTATGRHKWTFRTTTGIVRPPIVADGLVHAVCAEGILHTLDAATGEQCWQFHLGGDPGEPVVQDGVLYVGSSNGFLYALD